jgi:hypothetical protein
VTRQPRSDCWQFAHRVEYFQGRLGREHCFGPHAAKRRYLCRVVRPIVSNQSHRRDALRWTLKHECPKALRHIGGYKKLKHVCAIAPREIDRLGRMIHAELY